MPPPLLLDLNDVDLKKTILDKSAIYERLPHGYEFQILDGVNYVDLERRRIVAFVEVRNDAWWARGHLPGRPLLPGVLMLEMAAQASAVLAHLVGITAFFGYGGVDDCKFREAVVPPVRLHILCEGMDYRPRRIIANTQGVIDGRLAFEARVTGLQLTL
ncbi:MAG: beta-hydroxyacyl-ACP dehydratase [Planctomycetes bacterium]|nr:beta-hydroxyacyl-ACP dehydratase [Planctomycetota bacterium]MBI3834950.1 beta-hydroxyacyl-ACP dehydratase [Planctomycetota bacterium]